MKKSLILGVIPIFTVTAALLIFNNIALRVEGQTVQEANPSLNITRTSMQDIINSSTESYNGSGNMILRGFNITDIDAGTSHMFSIPCDRHEYPVSGTWILGSAQSLAVMASYPSVANDGNSLAWTVIVANVNGSESIPAAGGVLCASTIRESQEESAATQLFDEPLDTLPPGLWQAIEEDLARQQQQAEEESNTTTVFYGYYNVGSNIPCIITEGDNNTGTIETYVENPNGPDDVVVDFTLSVKNANVSLNPSGDFKPSVNRTITALEGTLEARTQTYYIRPYSDTDYLSLTLDAKAIDPANARLVYALHFSNTVVFFKDPSGNYCVDVLD